MQPEAVDRLSVDLSAEELALLVRLADASPLLGVAEPPLDDLGWSAVFNGLLARGVLEWRAAGASGEGEVGVAPGFAPLLGMALAAGRATSVQLTGGGPPRRLTFLRQGEIAVEHELTPAGSHRLTPIDGATVESRIAAILESTVGGAVAGTSRIEIPTEDYIAALDRLEEDGLEAAVDGLPAAGTLLSAIHGSRASAVVADLILEADGGVAGEVLSIRDGGPHGLWLIEQDEFAVRAEPVDPGTVLSTVARTIA